MNAQQARELTESKLIDFEEIMQQIILMAKSGNGFAVFRTKRIKDAEACAKQLKELGYKVELNDTHFEATW